MPENNKMGLSALVRKSKKSGLWGGCNRFCMPEAALSVPVDDKQYVMIVSGVSEVDPPESMEGKWLRECAMLRSFRELTLLEVRRERLRKCIRVAGVSGVDPFGSTEGIRLRDWARLRAFPGLTRLEA